MRDFKGMKRQRGRNRNTGGKPQQHNANRSFDSNGPEGIKVRGAAQSVFDKYQQLARDASTAGDRVLAENYLQHSEHYFRLLRALQPNRPASDFVTRDQFGTGYDIDFEAEPDETAETPAAEAEGQAEGGEGEERPRFENRQNRDQNQNRDDRPRDRFDNRQNRDQNQTRDQNQNRDDRPRDDRPRDDQGGRRDRWRDDRPRDDRPRDDRPRDDRPRDDRPRDDRPREDRAAREDRPQQQQDDRPREEREPRRSRYERDRGDRGDRAEARDPMPVIEPQAAPLAPEAPAKSSPRLRGQDGAVSELPSFLRAATAEPREEAPAAEAAAPKPRRRRAPKSFEGGEGSEEG